MRNYIHIYYKSKYAKNEIETFFYLFENKPNRGHT